jgi:hypothetical protein
MRSGFAASRVETVGPFDAGRAEANPKSDALLKATIQVSLATLHTTLTNRLPRHHTGNGDHRDS